MIKALVLNQQQSQQTHFVFEWLALLLGVQIYRLIKRRKSEASILHGKNFIVLMGCILGAALGNKLVFALDYPQLWQQDGWLTLLQGQSIVGGLLGGLLGVEIAKKLVGIQHSTGDDYVLPLIIGTVVGRIGCFLAGLHDSTYGIATSLPWGVDFGDGIARHPTQLYDMVFVVMLGLVLWSQRSRLAQVNGLTFKFYLAGYLIWRLCIDLLKPVPYVFWLGLSGIQWVCIVALAGYLPLVWRDKLKLTHKI